MITTIATEYKTARDGLTVHPVKRIIATVTTISREWYPYDLNDQLEYFFQ